MLHPRSSALALLLDPEWRRKLWLGGLVLCLPVVGWPAVLGYRAAFIRNLREPAPSVLPPWRGQFWNHVVTGWRAMLVIFGYLLPVYATLAGVLLARGYTPTAMACWLTVFFVLFPLFAPLSLPTACALLTNGATPWLRQEEAFALVAAYGLLVFLLPAGFLEVSRTWRFRSAFALWRTIPFVIRHSGDYVRAWWHSSCMSLVGHFALPLSPWGVVWCYLGIVTLFQEVLWHAEGRPAAGCMAAAVAAAPRGLRFGRSQRVDAAGASCTVFELGSFAAPLPGRPR